METQTTYDPLERVIYKALSYRVGKENAIKLKELHRIVRRHGLRADERQVRAVIQSLRKQGELICSAGGKDGGYWFAKDWLEVDAFFKDELDKRAFDLFEQKKAMKAKAESLWGSVALQHTLNL
jgi:hypothetical protein